MQAITRPTGYGLWTATLLLADGREVTGGGMTPAEAEQRAALKAQGEPCRSCGHALGRGEALVSRRALGEPLCGSCREKRRGGADDVDYQDEGSDRW